MTSRRRRALFVTHAPEWYGTFYRAFNLAKGLARQGYEVDLLCQEAPGRPRLVPSFPGVRVRASPSLRAHRDYAGEVLRSFINLRSSISPEFGIIHAFTCSQPSVWLPAEANILIGRPVFVDWDDIWGGGWAQHYDVPVRTGLTGMELSAPRSATGVTVVSSFLMSRAIAAGCSKRNVHCLPNGCDVDNVRPLPKADARMVLGLPVSGHYLGAVAGRHSGASLKFILQLLREVLKVSPEAKLIVAGQMDMGDEERSLLDLMKRSVIQMGLVDQRSVGLILGASDMALLPMSPSLVDVARWPIRLGDYLASGRPIASNAVGEVERVLQEARCGILAPRGGLEEFGARVAEALNDPQMLEELGSNARRAAEERYSWERVSLDLSQFYSSML